MAWTILETVKGFYRGSEALALADSAGANAVEVASTILDNDVSNTKFGVQVTMTEASAGDGALDCRLEGSVDGTNWATVDTSAAMDVDTTGLNTDVGILDASGTYFPYWRVVVFSDGTDTEDASALTLTIATTEVGSFATI